MARSREEFTAHREQEARRVARILYDQGVRVRKAAGTRPYEPEDTLNADEEVRLHEEMRNVPAFWDSEIKKASARFPEGVYDRNYIMGIDRLERMSRERRDTNGSGGFIESLSVEVQDAASRLEEDDATTV